MKSLKMRLSKLALAPAIVVLAIGMQVSPAQAQSYPQFKTTAAVNVRSGPGTDHSIVKKDGKDLVLPAGSWFGLVCQTQNKTNVGGNRTWDRIAINGDGNPVMYISDYYTTTPSFNSYVKAYQTPGFPDTPDCSRV